MSSAEQVTQVPESVPLRRHAIGLPDVVFTSVTTMAPASAAAFSIAVGALFAGGSLVFYLAGGGNPWNLIATAVWGGGWIALFIALLNSNAACSNGGGSAATRAQWALGRIRVLPAFFGRTHPRFGSPYIAVLITYAGGLVLTLWLGEQYTPLTAFALIGTIITGAIVPIYIAVNLACISFFWRERRSEFNVIKHLLFPVLGIVLFVPAFFADLGLKLFSFISPLTYPLSLAGIVIGVWYALGVVLVIYFALRHPRRIADTAKVFMEEDDAAEALST
jgi:amino acid transporter